MPPSAGKTQGNQVSFLIAAVAINLLIGVLYGWSVFLVPLEESLEVSRGILSLVPALGLFCFTAGVLVHDALVRRIPLPALSSGVMALAGLGHLLFWLFPGYTGLLLGYGAVFGFSGGVGYGLALALARGSSSPARGWAIGLTVAAFAASGMTVAALGAAFGPPDDVPRLFGVIGAAFCCSAVALGLLLRATRLSFGENGQPRAAADIPIRIGPFLCLAFGLFALCYPGLVFVSHGVAILSGSGLATALSSLTPFVLNAGYVLGALLGGAIAARAPGRLVPSAFLLASALAALATSLPLPALASITAVFVIGAGFGSTVPVFVILLTSRYGADRAGFLFGRLNTGYGLAGFLAPSISGWLYDLEGGYDMALWFAGLLGVLGILAIAGSASPRAQVPR